MQTSSGATRVHHNGNNSDDAADPASAQAGARQAGARVISLRAGYRWDDPLGLVENTGPRTTGRLVLWTVCILILLMLVWAGFGKLDIIASADGKLTPQTLLKIVQPAEAGVVQQLLVSEGDSVRAGQVLARLDTTLARADSAGIAGDLAHQTMQERRIEAELSDRPMLPVAGDDPMLFARTQQQYQAHRKAYLDSLEQERAMLLKSEHERRSAMQIQVKLEQTLPTYERSAAAHAQLEKEGFFSPLATAEKQREATEKSRDLEAQRSAVMAADATIAAQGKRISQIQSAYRSELEKERADIRAKIAQLQPGLEKSAYREGLMELKAPQDGVIKDLATTTVGAVVQPGSVVMTLVPQGEMLFADVNVKNEDVGFVMTGQKAQIKLAAYPFQKYGMLSGVVTHISADASEAGRQSQSAPDNRSNDATAGSALTYKARIRLDRQTLPDPQGAALPLTPGMQVVAEIHQGRRTVLEYLLSPVQKTAQEAGRER